MNKLTTLKQDQYRTLLEHIPAVVYSAILEHNGITFTFVSPQLESIAGIHRSEWVHHSEEFLEHIHPDDRERVLCAYATSYRTHDPIQIEYRIRAYDGRTLWFRDEATVLKGEDGVSLQLQGVMHDVTDRKCLEDELLRWDEEARALTEHLPDIVMRVDPQGRLLYLNKWFDLSQEVTPEEYIGKTYTELGLPENISQTWDKEIRRVCHEKMSSVVEFSVSSWSNLQVFESRLIPEYGKTGNVSNVLIISRDLTEKKKSEKALKESEGRFRQLAESIEDVFWLVDAQTQRFIYVSPAYEKKWGSSAKELYQNPEAWLSLIHHEDRMKFERSFIQKFINGTLDLEYRIVQADGSFRWIHDRAYPILNEEGLLYRIAGLAEDVTTRKQVEEERLRVSKLDSLGLLAGGLAHDFNNLLTAILGQLSLAKFFISSDNPIFHRLNEAEMASLRAQDLTHQLLTFAKGGIPVRKPASLSQIVEENARLVLTGTNVKCEFHLAKDLSTVEVDVAQMSQVVQNLAINAMQAMANGGTLSIFGQNLMVDEGSSRAQLELAAGNWVKVSFVDHGVGISKEQRHKIFDPYFTTKASGHGLGLATSYSIIQNHEGVLNVDSEVGVGTTFTILLPASNEKQVLTEIMSPQVRLGQGKVLVMDDEKPIRKVLGEMLDVCGYTHQAARNGKEAISLFTDAQEMGVPFDVVILDLTIPGEMGGRAIIQKMLKLVPSIKAIVVSGYSNDPVLSNFHEYGFHGRISKPFRLGEISEVIDSILSNTSHPPVFFSKNL